MSKKILSINEFARLGGKARWAKTPGKKQRSKIMKKVSAARKKL